MILENFNYKKIKIIDLGLAEYCKKQEFLFYKCGTPGYIAPEIINLEPNSKQNYSEKCDMFSLGAIMYKLVTK